MKLNFNIPNTITFIRVSLIPLFVIILLTNIPYKNLLAAFIFAMLSLSDFFDGYLARKKQQVTDFGKLIDRNLESKVANKLAVMNIGLKNFYYDESFRVEEYINLEKLSSNFIRNSLDKLR